MKIDHAPAAAGVYKITNRKTGSCYVGSAVNLRGRARSHVSALAKQGKAPPKLQAAWNAHGADAFIFEVVLLCAPHQVLLYEQIAMNAWKPKYNTREDAASNFGVRWSAETNKAKGRKKAFVWHGGQLVSRRELALSHGLTPVALKNRLARGVPLDQALMQPMTTPQERGRRGAKKGTPKTLTAFGRTGSLKDLVAAFGVVSYAAVVRRRCLGWELERALTQESRCK